MRFLDVMTDIIDPSYPILRIFFYHLFVKTGKFFLDNIPIEMLTRNVGSAMHIFF